ncbi:hypothetical protein Bbelb_381810 [Branchiostoma belcheri]|nr:hypothetical protein Bbelb_381810 [Branchiostoma belcheri]
MSQLRSTSNSLFFAQLGIDTFNARRRKLFCGSPPGVGQRHHQFASTFRCLPDKPITEYAAPVWHPGLTTLLNNKIERIQRRAVRIIMGHDYTRYSEACLHLVTETCEDDTLKLSCSNGEKLFILDAIYGRTTDFDTCCPRSWWSKCGADSCPAPNSLEAVKTECQGKQQCSVEASNDVFGDPCHGVLKYLEVSSACIREALILDANYGRTTDSWTCSCHWWYYCGTKSCRAPTSLETVKTMCQGKQQCSVEASNDVFSDQCHGVRKYLEVSSACIAAASRSLVETSCFQDKNAAGHWQYVLGQDFFPDRADTPRVHLGNQWKLAETSDFLASIHRYPRGKSRHALRSTKYHAHAPTRPHARGACASTPLESSGTTGSQTSIQQSSYSWHGTPEDMMRELMELRQLNEELIQVNAALAGQTPQAGPCLQRIGRGTVECLGRIPKSQGRGYQRHRFAADGQPICSLCNLVGHIGRNCPQRNASGGDQGGRLPEPPSRPVEGTGGHDPPEMAPN